MKHRLLALVVSAGVSIQPWTVLVAQTAAVDSLRLGALIEQALKADPRQRLLSLQADESGLKDRNYGSGYLPSLTAVGQAQYNSDVFTFPFQLPGGQQVPRVRKDTYDASIRVEQTIYDPSIGLKRAVERAMLARSAAEVTTALYGIRQQVVAAFFTAAVMDQRRVELGTTIGGLTARLAEASSRFRAGTALPGDTAMIAASILLRRQDVLEAEAERQAALARLGVLTGQPVSESALLALPELDQDPAPLADTASSRPEFAQFAALGEQLARQAAAEGATTLPRVSLFGRVGYGLPGLNPLNTSFDGYWTVGAQVSWAPFDWGRTRRRRQAFEIERDMVTVNQDAFARDLRVAAQHGLATITRLTAALALDDQIVALREKTEHEAQIRLAEGAVTTAEYVDRNTELLSARLDRVQHRVELARSKAELLTLLGAETR